MMKEVVRALDAGLAPQIGLVAFLIAFVLVVIYAFAMSRHQRNIMKNIPLDEGPVVGTDGVTAASPQERR